MLDPADRKALQGVVIVVHADTDLVKVVVTRHAPGRLARRLHGRQQKRNQNPDDCDSHQKFNKRKGQPFAHLRILFAKRVRRNIRCVRQLRLARQPSHAVVLSLPWLVGLLTSEPRFPGLLTVKSMAMAERVGNLAVFCHSGGAVPEFHRCSLFVDPLKRSGSTTNAQCVP